MHVLLFFKYYDNTNSFLTYCGLAHVELQAKVAELFELMWAWAGLPMGTPLKVYEEVHFNCIYPLTFDSETTLEKAVERVEDGDIVVFERADVMPPPNAEDGPASLVEYYEGLLHRVEVLFVDRNVPDDPGFTLELSLNSKYWQIAKAVAMRLGADPLKLQFFRSKSSYRDGPLSSTFDGTLRNVLMFYRPCQVKMIYFQHVSGCQSESWRVCFCYKGCLIVSLFRRPI